MPCIRQLTNRLESQGLRVLLAMAAGALVLQACSDSENGITVSKPPPEPARQAPVNAPQPYVLVPVPQGSWGVPQAPTGWGQPSQQQQATQAPAQGQPYQWGSSGNPWQPGPAVQPQQQPQYQQPGFWGQAGMQMAPVMPQFRPLDEQSGGSGAGRSAQMAAPYDRPQGSSQHPGQPGYGYGHPGYATGPYGYPGAPGAWGMPGMTAPWPMW